MEATAPGAHTLHDRDDEPVGHGHRWITATYEVAAGADEIEAVARALATEQSVEMPLGAITDQRVLDEVVGRVGDIAELGPGLFRVELALAAETVGDDAVQLANMVFGNCSLQDEVRLVELELPAPLLATFTGPRVGIDGLRARCAVPAGVRRALTCTAVKPQGLPPAALAELCGRFARAGLDLIKDDHGMADQPAAPFRQRVEACQRAVQRAAEDTGHTSQYVPSLVGTPQVLRDRVELCRDLGIRTVLVAPSLIGWGAFRELVDDCLAGGGGSGSGSDDAVAVLAHPAFAGAARIDPPLLLGRLFRLLGADATIFPNAGGRFSYSPVRCAAIAEAARAPWGHLAPCLPVPAGGMTTDRVGELLDFYGNDVMLLIGGSLLAAGDRLEQEAHRFVATVAERAG